MVSSWKPPCPELPRPPEKLEQDYKSEYCPDPHKYSAVSIPGHDWILVQQEAERRQMPDTLCIQGLVSDMKLEIRYFSGAVVKQV